MKASLGENSLDLIFGNLVYDIDTIMDDGIPSQEFLDYKGYNRDVCEVCNKKFPNKKSCGWYKGETVAFRNGKLIKPVGSCNYETEHVVCRKEPYEEPKERINSNIINMV